MTRNQKQVPTKRYECQKMVYRCRNAVRKRQLRALDEGMEE